MVSVRMGELAVSADPGEELVALGLGSCIGLALLDRSSGIAGLAHVVLPEAAGSDGPAAKFGDLVVPAMLAALRSAGARAIRLEAVMAGGAQMFSMNGRLDIGARNSAAVQAGLQQARIPVRVTETGGSQGRTLRVVPATGTVTLKVAGGPLQTLLEGRTRGGQPIARATAAPRLGFAGSLS